uniref:NADH-ubiquinone oxidoreductase chain 2 n=1 Tax=Mustela lutreola TaxID=9666 RepID=A0A7U1ARL3_MUSLU|nr:NADH dehydrogenase subunit 2 [Mustela lutreola]QQY85611.1 NADH dehydrogenase subunit 2 [Mustela lutreola]QQY85637.1 NADH dehydrogenase subunit 2 [Mustela lutreola]QQY85650.1 NADH dehydrogenase subunit 2 [Mustela lutreola]QQY85663.1 NADH dehydrogenase subunit 2 [Mustela lutreola]WPM90938.1 NADH dehydrogenase subunit 2 [Mustela lutreola]
MKPPILTIIMFTIISGTIMVLMSSHWLTIWIGFEMNMLAIIPILMKKFSPRAIEAATKYFLTQATASMLLMLGIIMNLLLTGQWTALNILNPIVSNMMTVALSMKLGLSPFHFWVPEVTQGVPLMSGMILLTWQKIAPLSVLYQMAPSMNTHLLMTMAFMSVLIGGWGGLNQTQLRKILAYSSIAHMGWMIAVTTYNPTLMLLNLTIYIMMTLGTFMLFSFSSSTTTLSLSLTWNKLPLITSLILTIMLSLGGLPPLSGFVPKWMIIHELTKNNMITAAMFMTITALLNLYFYMRLTYATALTLFPSTNNMKMKWQFESTKNTTLLPPLIVMSTMLLPLTPMMPTLF